MRQCKIRIESTGNIIKDALETTKPSQMQFLMNASLVSLCIPSISIDDVVDSFYLFLCVFVFQL